MIGAAAAAAAAAYGGGGGGGVSDFHQVHVCVALCLTSECLEHI